MKKIAYLAYPAMALLSLAAAFSAHAESPTPDDTATQVWSQTKTRAQVQAELVQARADGSIKMTSNTYNPLVAAKSLKTRQQVLAESRVARDSEYAVTWIGEDSGSFALARMQPARAAGPLYAGSVKPAQ